MKCPICHQEVTDPKYRPFCCKRCADVDLGNWFNEKYSFETKDVNEEDLQKFVDEAEKSQDCD